MGIGLDPMEDAAADHSAASDMDDDDDDDDAPKGRNKGKGSTGDALRREHCLEAHAHVFSHHPALPAP